MKKLNIITVAMTSMALSACQVATPVAPTAPVSTQPLDKQPAADSQAENAVLIIYYTDGTKPSLLKAVQAQRDEVIYEYSNFNAISIKVKNPKQLQQRIEFYHGINGVLQVIENQIMQLHGR